jgi:4-hydroxybenzoate polyprenyltransferase
MKELSVGRYPLFSLDFTKAYITTMRPYLLFVSGITGIAGMAAGKNNDIVKLSLIFLASFLSYGFGQALTDCFQVDTDSISSPYRPLTQGKISKPQVLTISLIGLTLSISVFSYYNSINIVLGIVSGIGLATYTIIKRKWWGGPFYNSWIVGVLFIIAYSASGSLSSVSFSISLWAALSAVFWGYANFVLSGYFKDISADAATGYYTLPVKYGRKVAVIVSDLFAFLALASAGILLYSSSLAAFPYAAFVFYLAGAILSLISQTRLHKVKTDDEAHSAISLTVHAYILLLSSVSLVYRPGWGIWLAVYYILFNVVLKLRPSKSQV